MKKKGPILTPAGAKTGNKLEYLKKNFDAAENQSKWQFHMRNFDSSERWFGFYHAGCAGTPWREGRPKCWGTSIQANPTGGDDSVYVPSDWVIHLNEWVKVVIDACKLASNIGMALMKEEAGIGDLYKITAGVIGVTEDVLKAELADHSDADIKALENYANEAFNYHCNAINRDPEDVQNIASQMGLTNYGFLSGDSYNHLVVSANNYTNDGHGWSVLSRQHHHHTPDKRANAAFVSEGHLIYYWKSDDSDGFWTDY